MSDVRFKLTTNHTERKKNLRNTQRIHALSGIISKQHHVSNFNNKEYVSKNDITKPQKILGNHNKAASTYAIHYVSVPLTDVWFQLNLTYEKKCFSLVPLTDVWFQLNLTFEKKCFSLVPLTDVQ
jgi:hypothetical protein